MILIRSANPDLLAIRFRYNPAIIVAVKSVPGAQWNSTQRYWTLPCTASTALRIALIAWDESIVWDGMSPPALPGYIDPSWATTLFTAVGPTRSTAVFRALSKILHPDAQTGDTALMRQLLEAREDRQQSAA